MTLIFHGDQPVPFSASDEVIVLEPVSDDASEDALFVVASLLTHQCVLKFGFGYMLTLHRLSRQKITMPVTTNASGEQIIGWEGMHRHGRALRGRAERAVDAVLESAQP
ncbi:restriction endonuclease subunit S [Arthrobacter sulfonylureivorans]|uniref:Restriction endonuclease subunit S n=1 Tax=Arthrobacter sulfonylureivorans TaxID=2486855 RepID=A0ABY3W709_9MICC|nr:restriction endonuclease subunit S [Arthrobacter sulfonylureivorans]UNK46089.1 restriction endonuclease subunit S [Arthrobacter sulfonylureivorans]